MYNQIMLDQKLIEPYFQTSVLFMLLVLALVSENESFPQNTDNLEKVGTECKLNGRVFRSGASFSDGCNKCRCNEGIVSCLGKW